VTPPTFRQLEVLAVVARSVRERGYPPTIREIGDAIGIRSTNGVDDHLEALRKKGFIFRNNAVDAKSRTNVPTAAGWSAVGLEPPPPKRPRFASSAPIVEVNLGWRCTLCNAHTFDASKPCSFCALLQRERAAS